MSSSQLANKSIFRQHLTLKLANARNQHIQPAHAANTCSQYMQITRAAQYIQKTLSCCLSQRVDVIKSWVGPDAEHMQRSKVLANALQVIRRLLAQEAERTAAHEKLKNLKLQVDAKRTLNSQTEGLLVGFKDAAVQPVFFLKKGVTVEKLKVFIHVRTCATLKPRGAAYTKIKKKGDAAMLVAGEHCLLAEAFRVRLMPIILVSPTTVFTAGYPCATANGPRARRRRDVPRVRG
jgi:hypothetical protein